MSPREADRARRLPPEERRQHLVETALSVFAADGFAETDPGDVAAAAGVGRPLIYHYFPGGKEDLYVAALELAWVQLVERLTVDPQRGKSLLPANLAVYLDLAEAGDPAVALVRQSRRLESVRIQEVTRFASTEMARRVALNRLGNADPSPTLTAALRAFFAYFESLLEEMLEGEIDRSQVEALVAETLPRMIEGAQAAEAD
jgi:AcrR family transcriptional regulator